MSRSTSVIGGGVGLFFGVASAGAALLASMIYTRAKTRPKPSKKRTLSSGQSSDEQVLEEFRNKFLELKQAFLDEAQTKHEMPEAAVKRLDRMLEYNCDGGKMNRAMLTITTVRSICSDRRVEFEPFLEKAIVLGWCIEILQAMFLVADDIMDGSLTRRGKPCWYKNQDVQLDAVNDTLILESFMYFLLKRYLGDHPFYKDIVQLYQEVSLQTQLGQMLDLTSQPQGQKNVQILRSFNLDIYKRIVRYKTAYYSFYLPIAAGMLLCGISEKQEFKVAEEISIELGEKFQIQDDYLDCFGDPQVIGKLGTDIQDHKCSWLVVQALLRLNAKQRQLLEAHYGKDEPSSVTAIKNLYRELNMEEIYAEQERQSYERIVKLIKSSTSQVPNVVYEHILNKIHNRKK